MEVFWEKAYKLRAAEEVLIRQSAIYIGAQTTLRLDMLGRLASLFNESQRKCFASQNGFQKSQNLHIRSRWTSADRYFYLVYTNLETYKPRYSCILLIAGLKKRLWKKLEKQIAVWHHELCILVRMHWEIIWSIIEYNSASNPNFIVGHVGEEEQEKELVYSEKAILG